jgi:predicted lipid-binding transport protein (Tim44 family)
MDFGTGFPIDLILFGMIAAFLVLRLRSILGRRTGFERPPQPHVEPYQSPRAAPPPPTIEGRAERVPSGQPARTVPEPSSTIGATLSRMRTIDSGFDSAGFLDGAEKAFRIIVTSFAAADRTTLRGLVADDVYRAFDEAIGVRERAGQTQASEIRAINTAVIEDAALRGSVAQVTVRFVSDQMSLTKDAQGQPVAGTDAVTEITDIWTFERDLTASDPTWRLVSVRGA